MIKFFKKHWPISLELVLFALIVTGIVPRVGAFGLAGFLVIYSWFAPLEDSVLLFIQSMPLFIALPFPSGHDNFNTWRIVSIVIFIRWMTGLEPGKIIRALIPNKKETWALYILWLIALVSVLVAQDQVAAITRIIYFANLLLVPIVLANLIKRDNKLIERAIVAIAVPTIIVTAVGYIQIISTYFIDIYQFMHLWGEQIQLRQFGSAWSYIAVHVGNTWLAYYGPQLSLRVFSLFPDSHTFPLFLVLGLPAIFAISLAPMVEKVGGNLKRLYLTRSRLMILMVPAIYLIAILSGTRGIWAAGVGAALWIITGILFLRRYKVVKEKRALFIYISSYIIIFFMLFAVAYPIFVSPQFLLSKGDWALLGNRIKSILDFGETSNAQRIVIWKDTLHSIAHHPILGVGIGNFPVVLSQNIILAKAGSSAHNLYLHIAAELGIPALIVAFYFLAMLLWKTYQNFLHSRDSLTSVYFAALLISWHWLLFYVLTDVTIFDERMFLILATTVVLVLGYKND